MGNSPENIHFETWVWSCSWTWKLSEHGPGVHLRTTLEHGQSIYIVFVLKVPPYC